MGKLIDTSNIRVKPQYMQDVMGIAMIRCEDLSRILADVPPVKAIPKDQINKAIEKIEQYICDVETDTVKAQSMAQTLDMFEQMLGDLEDGNNN